MLSSFRNFLFLMNQGIWSVPLRVCIKVYLISLKGVGEGRSGSPKLETHSSVNCWLRLWIHEASLDRTLFWRTASVGSTECSLWRGRSVFAYTQTTLYLGPPLGSSAVDQEFQLESPSFGEEDGFYLVDFESPIGVSSLKRAGWPYSVITTREVTPPELMAAMSSA